MMKPATRATRRGTVVPYLALTIVGLIAFLALAIDVGLLTIAKAQAQNAADLAVLTAMRSVNGDPSNNYNISGATANAQSVLAHNYILGQSIQPAQLQLNYGSYDYNQTTQTFNANYPPTPGKPTTAASATVTTGALPAAFSGIFGSRLLPNLTATAQAVHRPRDIALVMDLSGSMRMGTCLGYDFYTGSRTTNNPDSVVPTFGHYSSASANMQGPSSGRTSNYDNYAISPSNATAGNSSYTQTYVNNFYQNAPYASTVVRAFDSYTSTDGGTTWSPPTSGTPTLPPSTYTSAPGGDAPLFKNGSTTTYATDVTDVLNSSSVNALWELDGYSAYSGGKLDTSGTGGVPKVWTQPDYSASGCQFNGYTQGPGYYGKTFFLWPPDPRSGAITNTTTLKSYLNLIGITDTTDQSTIASNWGTWTLAQLQSWLAGTTTHGGPYKATGAYVPGSGGKAPIYYAVCRLFNRGSPAGSSNGQFSADWRVRFFGTNDNTKLFNSSGSLNPPGSSGMCSAAQTYNAILSWIASSPSPFPTQMRAGRVKYYGSIPTSITGSWPSYGSTDQRFWVEVIDYTLGYKQTASGSYRDVSAMAGYGSDFTWGTKLTNSPPSAPQSMNYSDNPLRPRLRGWFGPLVATEYLQNYNMMINTPTYYTMTPGDSYEAPQYTLKEAFIAAVNTMENNHPNDWFALVPFSWPRVGSSGADYGSHSGRFNCVSCPMGTNYDYARSALLFPFSTINADGSPNNTEITPYDADPVTNVVPSANFTDTPRPDGDTCFPMALMLCYNQFALTPATDSTLRTFVSSTPIAFPTGMAGGMGRKGAQKVIIFETDGIPNTNATANLATSSSGYTYYQVRYDMNKPLSSEYPSAATYGDGDPTVTSQTYALIDKLASTYGTPRNPFRLYAIGFGPVFQGADAASAETVLQTMQYHAGTQSSASTPLAPSQVVTGTDAQMSANMIATYKNILQSGVQIALIK